MCWDGVKSDISAAGLEDWGRCLKSYSIKRRVHEIYQILGELDLEIKYYIHPTDKSERKKERNTMYLTVRILSMGLTFPFDLLIILANYADNQSSANRTWDLPLTGPSGQHLLSEL